MFQALTQLGKAGSDGGELARGMLRLAEAIDERTMRFAVEDRQ
jgi:hypothetical protein